MRGVAKVVDEFVGRAMAANPIERPRILRAAASAFAQAANDPRNVHKKRELTNIGLEFVGAAQQAQQATTTDFLQLVRDTAEAYENLPAGSTHSTEAMDMLSMMPAITSGAAPGGTAPGAEVSGVPGSGLPSPRVSIAPASFDTNTTLGRTATVTYAPTNDQIKQGIFQSQTVAFWQGSKQESQAMSVDVGTVLQPVPSAQAQIDSRLYAQIQYGADGNTQNLVVVDVGLGRRLTVVGNYVSVSVGMDPPSTRILPDGSSFHSAVVSVGASIGTFAAPSQAPVIRTIYIDALAAGATTVPIQIPLRAVQLLAPLSQQFNDTLTINFFSLAPAIIASWKCAYSSATPFLAPFPVPPDAYFITVSSVLGISDKGGIRIPFELSL